MGARQDLLRSLSGEVLGLRRRGAREVVPGGGSLTPKRGVGEVALGWRWLGSFIGPRQGMGSHPYMVGYLVIRGYGVGGPDTSVSCIGIRLPMEP